MLVRMRGLGIVGTILLVLGLYLGFERVRWLYPGLVIVAGCIMVSVFLLVNKVAWPAPSEHPAPVRDDGPPLIPSDGQPPVASDGRAPVHSRAG